MKYTNSNRVFVINKHGKSLMPCKPRKARLLLKNKQAKVVNKYPFTIKLLVGSRGYAQETHLGVDTGQRHIGLAVTNQSQVLYQAEVELRQDVHKLLYKRKIYRRSKRNRKTRYRQPRFNNRVHGKRDSNWLPPSTNQKVNHNINWINKLLGVLPKCKLFIEVGKFDIAKVINPNIHGKEYQEGNLYNWLNRKHYVLARDNYTCQLCKRKSTSKNNLKLVAHHLIYRSKGGSDRVSNLITLCTDCHTAINHKPGHVLYDWYLKQKQVTHSYSGATFMNILRRRLFKAFPQAEFSYGYQTVVKRKNLFLPKGHFTDAIAISGIQHISVMPKQVVMIQQFRKKKRSLQDVNPKKGRKRKNTTAKRNWKNTKESHGIALNDYVHVRNSNLTGYVNGFANKGYHVYLKDGFDNYLAINGRPYIKTRDCQLITHNNNWRKISTKVDNYEFK